MAVGRQSQSSDRPLRSTPQKNAQSCTGQDTCSQYRHMNYKHSHTFLYTSNGHSRGAQDLFLAASGGSPCNPPPLRQRCGTQSSGQGLGLPRLSALEQRRCLEAPCMKWHAPHTPTARSTSAPRRLRLEQPPHWNLRRGQPAPAQTPLCADTAVSASCISPRQRWRAPLESAAAFQHSLPNLAAARRLEPH